MDQRANLPESSAESGKMPAPKPPKKGVSLPVTIAVAIVMGISAFVVGTRADGINLPWQTKAPSVLDLSSVQHTYSVLQAKFNGDLNANELIEGANRGLVDAAGDPYTTYFSEQEAQEFLDGLEGQFEGIGAELGKRDDKVTVISTLDDTPAKKSGLLAGDVIVQVNDQDTTSWSIDKAVSEIRGEKGTTVKLTILRGGSEVKEFSIVRDTITDPSVKSEVKDGIGIMRISRFGDTDTVMLARQAAESFKNQNVKGIVLDMRGNGGGYLQASQQIAGLWLSSDQVVVTERRGDQVVDTLNATGDPILKGIPTVVLVDGGSASASEIVAGALSDHKAARLVGTKTYGKGSVQQIEDLPGGAKLKVTIAGWFTPSGQSINKEGITPGIKVEITSNDINAQRDPQHDRAIELLKN
jgi:carboxyl-terminal processing protease